VAGRALGEAGPGQRSTACDRVRRAAATHGGCRTGTGRDGADSAAWQPPCREGGGVTPGRRNLRRRDVASHAAVAAGSRRAYRPSHPCRRRSGRDPRVRAPRCHPSDVQTTSVGGRRTGDRSAGVTAPGPIRDTAVSRPGGAASGSDRTVAAAIRYLNGRPAGRGGRDAHRSCDPGQSGGGVQLYATRRVRFACRAGLGTRRAAREGGPSVGLRYPYPPGSSRGFAGRTRVRPWRVCR
jgi:hypothetical protein